MSTVSPVPPPPVFKVPAVDYERVISRMLDDTLRHVSSMSFNYCSRQGERIIFSHAEVAPLKKAVLFFTNNEKIPPEFKGRAVAALMEIFSLCLWQSRNDGINELVEWKEDLKRLLGNNTQIARFEEEKRRKQVELEAVRARLKSLQWKTGFPTAVDLFPLACKLNLKIDKVPQVPGHEPTDLDHLMLRWARCTLVEWQEIQRKEAENNENMPPNSN